MDAVKFLKEKRRMCKSMDDCICCEMYFRIKEAHTNCGTYIFRYPEEAVAIVEKWAQEHPRKTMLQDFLEKHPKILLLKDGIPNFCPQDLGYCKEAHCERNDLDCVECWNRPLEE